MKKLYVIVEYDLRDGGYLNYAVDGIVFEDEKTAEEYMNIMPRVTRAITQKMRR